MAAPSYSAADYLAALQALMPRGRAWSRDPDAVQTKALSGLTHSFQRANDRANALLVDAFPPTTYELLPEWETTLGLPDPCAGEAPSIAARQAEVLARFVDSGGQSVPHFISFAAALGYTITITEYAAARVGESRVGDPIADDSWASVWAVNAPLNSITYAKVGVSAVGDPLASWGNTVLECEIRARAPAHTLPLFLYA